MMTLDSHTRIWNGEVNDFNGDGSPQCMDEYNQGVFDVWGLVDYPIKGAVHAYQLAELPLSTDLIERLGREDYKYGDAVVFRGDMPGSGGSGHVGWFIEWVDGKIKLFDQLGQTSQGGFQACGFRTYSTDYVACVLRKKEKKMVTDELFNAMWVAFVRIPPTQADRDYAIGKPLDQYIMELTKNVYATVQRSDVDVMWKKFMKTKPANADYNYAQGLNYGRYMYDLMMNPNCVNVSEVTGQYELVPEPVYRKKG